MNFYDLHSQIFVHRNNGQIWNFYISNNSLFYRIVVNNAPIKKIKLIDSIKSYDAALNTGDDIDLVCVKNNNELIYFKHSNNSWKRKTFKKTSSKSDIDFVNILNLKNSVHIFYAFRNPAENKPYKVFHIHSQSNQWKYNYLAPVMIMKNIRPYFIDHNKNGEILFLYKFNANTKNRGKIYVKTFNSKKNRWSSAGNLKFKNENTNILNLLIDSRDTLHFVFKENDSVKYLSQHFNDFNSITASLQFERQISLGDMEDSAYNIFEVDDSLWISWKTNSKLYYICSKKQSKDLNERELYKSNGVFGVKYLGYSYKDKSFSKPLFTFGTSRNNEIYLLGLDDEFFASKDIKIKEPKNEPVSEPQNELEDDHGSNLDRSWYSDDDNSLDLLDEPIDYSEENEAENGILLEDEKIDTETQFVEPTSIVNDEQPSGFNGLLVENKVEKDSPISSEEINYGVNTTESASNLDIEIQQDKGVNNIEVSDSDNIHDHETQPIGVEISEKANSDIIYENQPADGKNLTKKSFFERMKDFLTNN